MTHFYYLVGDLLQGRVRQVRVEARSRQSRRPGREGFRHRDGGGSGDPTATAGAAGGVRQDLLLGDRLQRINLDPAV